VRRLNRGKNARRSKANWQGSGIRVLPFSSKNKGGKKKDGAAEGSKKKPLFSGSVALPGKQESNSSALEGNSKITRAKVLIRRKTGRSKRKLMEKKSSNREKSHHVQRGMVG